MSLVGTRPILPDELEQYELHHRARIAIGDVIKSNTNIKVKTYVAMFMLGLLG